MSTFSAFDALNNSSTPSALESEATDIQSAINDDLTTALATRTAALAASAQALGIGGPTGSTATSAAPAAPAATVTSNPLSSANNSITRWLNSLKTAITGGTVAPTGQGTTGGLPSFLRIVAFVVGLGLLLIGVFFLRPVQSVVQNTVSTAKKGAALFA